MGKLLLVVALCAGTALGQRATGTLRGQVFDGLGGVIVGATVYRCRCGWSRKDCHDEPGRKLQHQRPGAGKVHRPR